MTGASGRASGWRTGLATAPSAVLALVLVAFLVTADGIPVLLNRSTDSLHAERAELPQRFVVMATRVLPPIPEATPPVGSADAPVELNEALAPASTGVAALTYAYAVEVVERTPDAVRAGTFEVTLSVNGVTVGRVFATQEVDDPFVAEGVRAVFALGAELAADPGVFVVTVLVQAADGFAFTLQSVVGDTFAPEWEGVGGAIDGARNPDLEGRVGEPVTVTIVNADNGFHNYRVLDDTGAVVAGPTNDIATLNDQQEMTWIPAAAGTFTYECEYHPTTMSGRFTITEA